MTNIDQLRKKIKDQGFWQKLNPELTISDSYQSKKINPLVFTQSELQQLAFDLKEEGYFQLDSILPQSEITELKNAVCKLHQSNLLPIFSFVYDEFWQITWSLSQILQYILGEDYILLPAIWAWYLNPEMKDSGWSPHRDQNQYTLLPDGMPQSLTIWIPLTDANPLNGCMYLLPASLDPNYYQKNKIKNEITNLQDIRAIPAKAGSVLCWTQLVFHWGGRSSQKASHPRISIAFEFQRGDVKLYNNPSLEPLKLPNFQERLGLIGKQLLQYQHMHSLSKNLAEIATELSQIPIDNTLNLVSPSQSKKTQLFMDKKFSEQQNAILQEYEQFPYPNTPLEKSPKTHFAHLYLHNMVTAYYLRNKEIITNKDKLILDIGCGSGFSTLMLAEANPQAKIIGIDISNKSLDIAKQRLKYHGFEEVEFHQLGIENLTDLDLQFDYINSDELLYLLPDITNGLKAMKSVLKPTGIIRTNLHNSLQRIYYYQAQSFFKQIGLMKEDLGEEEITQVKNIFESLKDNVMIKHKTWQSVIEGGNPKQGILMNYLIHGDKGHTVSELLEAIQSADLEFIRMLNWKQWELINLFKDPRNLPEIISTKFNNLTVEEELHLCETLNPICRLMDFWCGHPHQQQEDINLEEWTISDWKKAKVYLHPQLINNNPMREAVSYSISHRKVLKINKYLPMPGQNEDMEIESDMVACLLLPLLESGKSMEFLIKRWQKINPIHPLTATPLTEEQALNDLKQVLIPCESYAYILLNG